ncbi:hypothetical protein TRSC58_04970 [Trypanosoma rangeli SC58]|uniref:Uncharacterized protein n=1 Tax=Trypanosoma rangeli SC58 TaxID=429131 RepID=A0A061J219_TRYRA|nr:hypothetical protein TRSC58_04970 [Trypanosoma rangeli SC58]
MEVDADLGSVSAAFRGTEEYAAAFDLEVWKAQQQARLRSELNKEKTRLRRELAAEVRKKEEERLGELDAFRQELEQVARRLQLREETLQKRISQFETREAVFDARRVKVAEQHEQHLLSVEDRTRRQLEEAVVREGLLRAQLREREGIVARLEEKLRAAEGEHDTLQRCLARTVAEDKDKAQVTRLEEASAAANAAVAMLQLKLKERETELAVTRKERDQFQEAAKQCRSELTQLARRYSELQQRWHQRERALLDDEHRRLEETKRQHQLLALQTGSRARSIYRCDLLGLQAAEGIVSKTVRDELATRDNPAADTSAFLKELQAEVAQGLRELRAREKKKGRKAKASGVTSAGPRIVYAEVSPPRRGARSSHVRGSDGAAVREEAAEPGRHRQQEVLQLPATRDDAANSTLSSLTQRGSEGQRESTEPYHSPLEEKPQVSGVEEEEADVDVSSSYCYADVESWIAERGEPRDMPKDAVRGDVTRSSLPPLPSTAAASPQPTPPLPEDFLQASRAALPSASQASTREEMAAFVKKLRVNKQRLIESGVYTEDDTLLKEMTDKIALYEDFLLKHF